MHGSFGDLPLWLDEGLAEFFENDLVPPGAELERVELITKDLAGGWTPDLERLASISDIRQMTLRDYREAWAWVHLFLKGPASGKAVMASCLNDLHQSPEKFDLWQRMAKNGGTTDRLLAHLKAVPSCAIGVEQASTEGRFGYKTEWPIRRPVRRRHAGYGGAFADGLDSESIAASSALPTTHGP